MHNLSCENKFYLHENEKRFPYQRLSTYPRFETEARAELGNGLFTDVCMVKLRDFEELYLRKLSTNRYQTWQFY